MTWPLCAVNWACLSADTLWMKNQFQQRLLANQLSSITTFFSSHCCCLWLHSTTQWVIVELQGMDQHSCIWQMLLFKAVCTFSFSLCVPWESNPWSLHFCGMLSKVRSDHFNLKFVIFDVAKICNKICVHYWPGHQHLSISRVRTGQNRSRLTRQSVSEQHLNACGSTNIIKHTR